jgi:hypothetical protein
VPEDRAELTFRQRWNLPPDAPAHPDHRNEQSMLRAPRRREERTMKKLKLNRNTIRTLTNPEFEHVHGGAVVVATTIRTNFCPVLTNGCTGGTCVQTITSGTSVINPSGG